MVVECDVRPALEGESTGWEEKRRSEGQLPGESNFD